MFWCLVIDMGSEVRFMKEKYEYLEVLKVVMKASRDL